MSNFFSKLKSFMLNMPSSFSKMSILKKTYVILWTISISLIFVIIGMVSGLRNELDSSKNKSNKIEIIASRSAEDKITLLKKSKKADDLMTLKSAIAAKDKTKYFVQATKDQTKIDVNNPKIENNHFYPISVVEKMNSNNGLFNFKSFYVQGFHEDKVKVIDSKVKTATKTTLTLKELYDDANLKAEDYDLKNPISGGGFALYSDKQVLTDKAKVANNATAAIGGLFLLGITSSIIVTVLESRRVKRVKGGNK